MRAAVWNRRVPKQGHLLDDCEDAAFPSRVSRNERQGLRIGVADGTTEGLRSGPWATMLLETVCRARGDLRLNPPLTRAMRRWDQYMQHYLRERLDNDRPIQWFERRGLDIGEAATLLVASLAQGPGDGGTWTAISVGDCELFHVRESSLLRWWPIADSSLFGRSPPVVTSKCGTAHEVVEEAEFACGEWRPGDQFILATDAIAEWLLSDHEQGNTPWAGLTTLLTEDRSDVFTAWVSDLRQAGSMRNDDVAVLLTDLS